jgi:hypothetical protein
MAWRTARMTIQTIHTAINPATVQDATLPRLQGGACTDQKGCDAFAAFFMRLASCAGILNASGRRRA